MNWILLEPGELSDGRARLSDERAVHVRQTLRAEPGHTIRIGVVDGPLGTATIEALDADGVRLRCAFEASPPPRPLIDLLLALPRPKVLKRLWAPLASLGVGRIILTNAAKVERSYFDTHVLRPDFYRPLLIEGLQQAGDTRVPDVRVCRRFRPLVEDELDGLFPSGKRVVGDPASARRPSRIGFGRSRRVLLAIGPEGGWTPFEIDLLRDHGFVSVGLGPRPLRTDVACIALLSVVGEAMATRRSGSEPGRPD